MQSGPRTRLKAAFVVGHQVGAQVLWRDAEVVFSGNTIEFVGQHFPGHVDQTVDYGHALISPGLIDLDALGDRLHRVPGVLEHGLFAGMAEQAVLGTPDGRVEILRR